MTNLSTPPRLFATFRPQAWVNEYAVDAGPQTVFDATEPFLRLPLGEIRSFRSNDYDSDHLAEDLPERMEHSGPFEVDVDVDEWLESNGVDDRSELTQQTLSKLRERHGVNVSAIKPAQFTSE